MSEALEVLGGIRIEYQLGYKYRLRKQVSFTLPAIFREFDCSVDMVKLQGGVLTVAKGYAWDGASGPTVDTKDSMRGSLLHDALYQLIREGQLPRDFKQLADQLFYSMCRRDGMGVVRAWLWFRALVRFGKPAIIRNKDVLIAP